MKNSAHVSPVDYLIVGHLCIDLTPKGRQLGGTAAYAALTANALGMRVGIVTAWGGEISLNSLKDRGIALAAVATSQSTCFENIRINNERVQILHHAAPSLNFSHIPEPWQSTPIIHLGPVAQEISPRLVKRFPCSKLYLTPQGWLRDWDRQGNVRSAPWPDAAKTLEHAEATVISIEDVAYDEERIQATAAASNILVVTEGERGARVCWQGNWEQIPAPNAEEVDSTGAGDIFAATFFTQLSCSKTPWEAAVIANKIAAQSVTTTGLDSIPTDYEFITAKVQ